MRAAGLRRRQWKTEKTDRDGLIQKQELGGVTKVRMEGESEESNLGF